MAKPRIRSVGLRTQIGASKATIPITPNAPRPRDRPEDFVAFAVLADAVSRDRHGLPADHAMLAQERRLLTEISAFCGAARRIRDAAQERAFERRFGDQFAVNKQQGE